MKALLWYAIEHGYRSKATNAWPNFRFTDHEGKEHVEHIDKIVDEYAVFRERTYGRRKSQEFAA